MQRLEKSLLNRTLLVKTKSLRGRVECSVVESIWSAMIFKEENRKNIGKRGYEPLLGNAAGTTESLQHFLFGGMLIVGKGGRQTCSLGSK